jgi:hypothetical protein
MAAQESGHGQRQVLAHGRGIAAQAHMAGQARAVLGHVAAQALHARQHVARMLAQGMPGRRGPHATGLARQQGAAELLLHAAHALAGRGQRHVGSAGRCRERAAVQDVYEQLQVGEVESHGLWV